MVGGGNVVHGVCDGGLCGRLRGDCQVSVRCLGRVCGVDCEAACEGLVDGLRWVLVKVLCGSL